jgi:hypothetical protein
MTRKVSLFAKKFLLLRYGQDIGTLNVLIETLNETKNVFTRSGPLDNTWRLGQVNVQSANSYRIIFESTGK